MILLATQFLRIFGIFMNFAKHELVGLAVLQLTIILNFRKFVLFVQGEFKTPKLRLFPKKRTLLQVRDKYVDHDLEIGIEKDPLGSSETEPQS